MCTSGMVAHIFDQPPLLVCTFVSVYKRTLTSLSGKNLAKNGHSSYERRSLAQPPDASAASNFFLEGASASESDFARILSGFPHYLIPFKNDAFEGHMFDISVIVVAT